MIQVMKRLHARHPQATFLVACYRDSHRRRCLQQLLIEAPTLPVQLFVGKTSEIIEAADCALMVSGSISLEMMARKTPAVVLYRVSRVTGILGDLFLKCPFISLPNLIARREVMPEFLSVGNPAKVISGITDVLDRWVRLPDERQLAIDSLVEAGEGFVESGAIQKCAGIILEKLPEAASSSTQPTSTKAA
jgi:lipid-A-disaccharide synthase